MTYDLLTRVENLKKGDYEKANPYSSLAKLMIKNCLNLIDNDPDPITRKEFSIDECSDATSWRIIFTQLAKEDCCDEIDYFNDSFSVVHWSNERDDITSVYATYLFGKYIEVLDNYDPQDIANTLLLSSNNIRSEIDQELLDYFEAAYYLENRVHIMPDYAYTNHNPICDISESVYNVIGSYRHTNLMEIEYTVWDYYDCIEDDIIYGLEKEKNPNRNKIFMIYRMLYRIAAIYNKKAFVEYSKLGKPLPKFIMIYLYIILGIIVRVNEKISILTLIMGDINNITIESLERYERIITRVFKDISDDELIEAINRMLAKNGLI